MLQKKKYCDGCESEQYIWKNHKGLKFCKFCWLRENPSLTPRKPYEPPLLKSTKQSAKDQLYAILRKKFFENPQNHSCKANLPGCKVKACDVHHLYSGSKRDEYQLDTIQWLPVCRNCHHKIHDVLTMEEVIALGLKK